ncbi:MAG TPA: hypothetical protein VK463_14720 [Desulfomonilaceae bacterium]|nr:hypothetical protein [Desulfomonilaceae bacterium]
MAKGEPLHGKNACRKKDDVAGYDHVKEIITIATQSGLDLAGLGLVPKDVSTPEQKILTKRQALDRNRLVKSVLRRFTRVLTPPAPLDLERSIRIKDESTWLPWEREVIEKIDQWRSEVTRAKPEIMKELNRVMPDRF